MRTKLLIGAVMLVAAVGLVGCGSDSVTTTSAPPTNTVALKLVVNNPNGCDVNEPLAKIRPWNAGSPDSLTITSGKFLVRSLMFKDVSDYSVDTDITASDESRDQSDPRIIYQGPYVLTVSGDQPIDLGDQTVVVGGYNALSMVLHKGKSTDDLGTDTEMIGRSVSVSGFTWYGEDGDPFNFQLDLRTEIIIGGDFTVPADGNPEYVLEFDVHNWFRFADNWLNPNEPENLPLIYNNIQRKIKGGRDYNGNGTTGN